MFRLLCIFVSTILIEVDLKIKRDKYNNKNRNRELPQNNSRYKKKVYFLVMMILLLDDDK